MSYVDLFPIVFITTTFTIVIGYTLSQVIASWRQVR